MITKPVSLDAARRARSDGEGPAVIGHTVRPQTIFKARKMMMGLYLPILGIRRQKRSRRITVRRIAKIFRQLRSRDCALSSGTRLGAVRPLLPVADSAGFGMSDFHADFMVQLLLPGLICHFPIRRAIRVHRIVNYSGINPGQEVHSTIPSCKLNLEL
ncbi:hypothetical protein OUZ56_018333 [Daphnia magna]|uniref:Uncharacterized protein n=1 Tax=Daphnia magna TaxID=35525 RepID=A0ABQ9Z8J6_9CRUS|nr:hypothetical protein OUZ56_018333 [Daphnia magna]